MVRVLTVTQRMMETFALCTALSFGAHSLWGSGDGPSPQNRLKTLSLEELGRVEVTTVSKEPEELWQTPAAVYVLSQHDIRRSGALTLPDLLRTVPGVEVEEFEGNQWAVGIRGFDSPYSRGVLLLIDGRSTYTPLFEGVYWDVQDVLLSDIDRIEIIRGPGGTIWGANAVNGVINIITKSAENTQGVLATAAGGRLDRFNGAVREGLRKGARMEYRLFAKGFVREDEKNPNYARYDRWHLAHGGFRADWSLDPHDTLSAEGDAYIGASGQRLTIGSYTPLAQLVVNDTFDVSGGDFLIKWKHGYDGGSDFHVETYFDRTNRQGNQFGETRSTFDVDFISHLAVLPRQSVIWGAGAFLSPSYVIQTQPTVDFEPHAHTDYVYSAFLQDAFRLLPHNLTLTAGSKFEDNNYTGFEIQPDVRLLWNPVRHASFWGAISRAVRTPGRLDRDLQLTYVESTTPPVLLHIEGSPNFESEDLLGYEAGYRQLLGKTLFFDIAGFKNHYDRLQSYGARFYTAITSPVTATVINLPFANGIDSSTDGIEIASSWQPNSWWVLKGNFSHLHIEAHPRPGYTDTATAASYDGSSPHRTAVIQSLLNLPGSVEFDFDYRFFSRLPAQSVRSYQTMDAHASWLLKKSLRLTVTGQNLLQPQRDEFQGDNGSPVGIRRTAYAGITWTH